MKATLAWSAAPFALTAIYLVICAAYWTWGERHVDTASLCGDRAWRRLRALGHMAGWRETADRLAHAGVSMLRLERERPCPDETLVLLREARDAASRGYAAEVVEVDRDAIEGDGGSPAFECFRCRFRDPGRQPMQFIRTSDGGWSLSPPVVE